MGVGAPESTVQSLISPSSIFTASARRPPLSRPPSYHSLTNLIKMMDDEPDWLSEEPAPEATEPAPAAAPAAAAAPEEPKISWRERHKSLVKQVQALPKQKMNTHWARPRFLQYDYLYHYMHSYYDDCIDFLDRRMRGYEVEPPKPQTWAERALRVYTRNTYPDNITYNVPVPRQKSYTHLGLPKGYTPPHRYSYFRSATSSLVSTSDSSRLRLWETRPPKENSALLYTPHWANTWHSEHSKDYYNRKYKAILF